MNILRTTHRKLLGCAALACGALVGLPVLAQAPAPAAPAPSGIDRTYQEELAMCDHIQQDRAACIREAGAARQQARSGANGGGGASNANYTANALARCAVHPPAERTACEARITGAGDARTQGSVLGGGVIRESVTTVTMPAPPDPVPAPAAVPTAPSGPIHVNPSAPRTQPAAPPGVFTPTPSPVTVPQAPTPRALP